MGLLSMCLAFRDTGIVLDHSRYCEVLRVLAEATEEDGKNRLASYAKSICPWE